jgi:phosphocarrier protein
MLHRRLFHPGKYYVKPGSFFNLPQKKLFWHDSCLIIQNKNTPGGRFMVSATLEITNRIGFHARPASLLIDRAKQFSSTLTLTKGDRTVGMDSLVALLKLQVKQGDMVTLSAEGADEEAALKSLVSLIEAKFGEK